MSPSPIFLGFSAIATVALAIFVLSRQSHEPANRHFFVFAVCVAGWTILNTMFIENTDETVRYTIALASYGIAMALAVNFFLFCHDLALKKYSKKVLRGAKIIGCIAAAASAVPGVVAYGVDPVNVETHLISLVVYAAVLLLFIGGGLWLLARTVRVLPSKAGRRRIYIVLTGLSVSALIGVGCNLVLPLLGNYAFVSFGPLGSLVLVCTCAYAIVRYGLFDVRTVVLRTTAYALSLAVLAGLYILLVSLTYWLISPSSESHISAVNVSATLLLVLLFQPAKQFFDNITNTFFYHGRYSSERFYSDLSAILADSTELLLLLRRSSTMIAKTLGAKQACIAVFESDKVITVGTKRRDQVAKADIDFIKAWSKSAENVDKNLIISQPVPETDEAVAMSRLLRSYDAKMALLLRLSDGLRGVLFIGERLSGQYIARDFKVLESVADELAIAVQNALSLREVRLLNETLQHRINEATKELRRSNAQLRKLDEAKDEFISMASHQLRTPLTSIKGYIDMILEGDAGEITPTQRKFLTEAFVSSERMVHLINDFLNVSRLQTGKFMIDKRPVDLATVVGQELDSLNISASGRDLSFDYVKPTSLPRLMLDEAKIRQVIMNFADNALYYSHPGTAITVVLAVEDGEVVLSVKDTGIGVPEEEQARLFTKFYRASNARKQRPDGTGVGLYLAKRVITEHGGSVIFSSVEGKGSTFGFRLPLARLRVGDDADQLDNQPNDK